MLRVCPHCRTSAQEHFLCPKCGGQTVDAASAGLQPRAKELPTGSEAASFWIRMLAGLLMAQGLYYALRQLCQALVLATLDRQGQAEWWDSFQGLISTQAIQATALLIGGVFAGAGQRRGLVAGTVLGVWNAVLLLGVQMMTGRPANDLMLYCQPILHAFLGAVGGALGMMIWRPLPDLSTVTTPPAATPGALMTAVPPAPAPVAKQPPIAWGRVCAGVVVAAGGTIWASVIRDFFFRYSGTTVDKLQSQFITWEITVLAMLVGGAMAGASTRRGAMQGFLVGLLSAGVLCAFQFFLEGGRRLPIQDVLAATYGLPSGEGSPVSLVILAVQTWLLGIAGGWLGGQLLPPTVAARRKSLDSAAQ